MKQATFSPFRRLRPLSWGASVAADAVVLGAGVALTWLFGWMGFAAWILIQFAGAGAWLVYYFVVVDWQGAAPRRADREGGLR